MKSHYRKEYRWFSKKPNDWYYYSVSSKYYRRIRTYQEIRKNCADHNDYRDYPTIHKSGRGRNSKTLDSRNDFAVARRRGRSWKDYTRHSKQWMVANDPDPVWETPSHLFAWMLWAGDENV